MIGTKVGTARMFCTIKPTAGPSIGTRVEQTGKPDTSASAVILTPAQMEQRNRDFASLVLVVSGATALSVLYWFTPGTGFLISVPFALASGFLGYSGAFIGILLAGMAIPLVMLLSSPGVMAMSWGDSTADLLRYAKDKIESDPNVQQYVGTPVSFTNVIDVAIGIEGRKKLVVDMRYFIVGSKGKGVVDITADKKYVSLLKGYCWENRNIVAKVTDGKEAHDVKILENEQEQARELEYAH